MAPTLYYEEGSPPCRSVLLTAKALGVTFNLKPLVLFAGEHKTPEFLKINPQHTIPTLVEEDGFTLWDSHAINPYLVGKYGKDDSLYPKDLRKRAVVDQRLHFNNSVLAVRLTIPIKAIFYKKAKGLTQEQTDALKEAYGFLEAFLDGHNYVAGDQLTIADFHTAAVLTSTALLVPVSPTDFPRLTAWLHRMEAIPFFKQVNENGVRLFEGKIKSKLAAN